MLRASCVVQLGAIMSRLAHCSRHLPTDCKAVTTVRYAVHIAMVLHVGWT